MPTLHVVSHTHWDREWYLTFQQFRFRLVRLVEGLMEILATNPDFRCFLLDGQTVVLEDILDVRPELQQDLQRHVGEGSIHIGPWFVLPDEFLVSPEALVRNLLLGGRICRSWGAGHSQVPGYLPDTFGHISQLPQLLVGFGFQTAVVWRGVGDAPAEFRWAAPDGTELLVCYLRDSYGNVALLPVDEDACTAALAAARDSLLPHAAVSHLLLMQGTDHMRPRPDLPRLLAYADRHLPDRVIHSSLPAYVAGVRAELGEDGLARLTLRSGELRDSSRANLLPGVLSTRMWIKQRNHACQVLLEKWAEPFGTLLQFMVRGGVHKDGRDEYSDHAFLSPITRRAWRYLLENHAHDSICGCSADAVHREMVTRFDGCEQLGEELARTALEGLAACVDTGTDGVGALVVFNPSSAARTDRVTARVVPPLDPAAVTLVDSQNDPVPFRVIRHAFASETTLSFDRATMAEMLAQARAAKGVLLGEWTVCGLQSWMADGAAHVAIAATRDGGIPGIDLQGGHVARLEALLEDPAIDRYVVHLREDEALEITFVAREVPPLGHAAYRFLPRPADEVAREQKPGLSIENAFFRVVADPQTGLLTILDKETGWELRDSHRLVDGGDRGDTYNYCRPEQDWLIQGPAEPPVIRREVGVLGESLDLAMTYRLPEGLAPDDRSARSATMVDLPIRVRVCLTPGVRRIDFETTVENRAGDHRLRVHFPVPFSVDDASAGGHWDIVDWPVDLPADTEAWREQPQPTHPQQGWASVSDGEHGLTLASRGLPEIEVLRAAGGVEIGLTLLRCVEWLSRDDMHCRVGHAGPALRVSEAQCCGRYTFRYAVIPHAGDWRSALASAESLQTDLRAIATGVRPGPLPSVLSYVRVEPEALRVSALKAPEEGDGLVLRLWNSEDRPVAGTVHLWRSFARVVRADLAERSGETVACDTDAVPIAAREREVVTLRLFA